MAQLHIYASLRAPSHYLNQCCSIISPVEFMWSWFHWNALDMSHKNVIKNCIFKISTIFPSGQWVKCDGTSPCRNSLTAARWQSLAACHWLMKVTVTKTGRPLPCQVYGVVIWAHGIGNLKSVYLEYDFPLQVSEETFFYARNFFHAEF